jgi:protoheme IX farnesyltransferase
MDMFKQLVNLLKLRIGVIMMLTALVAMVVTPGQSLSGVQILVLAFAVLISAGSAGAFNQYFEIDLDSVMSRTKDRPFVTGSFHKSPLWILFILALLGAGVGSAALFLNEAAAMYIFLGAFFYAIVYTVLLKRRICWLWYCSSGHLHTSGVWPSPNIRTMPKQMCRCYRWLSVINVQPW